jgi:hypothetical protein
MGMECINGKMETGMKENGRTAWNMDKELIYLLIQTHTLDSINMESLMGLDNTSGRMAAHT